jgi:protein-disulfide isomerase
MPTRKSNKPSNVPTIGSLLMNIPLQTLGTKVVYIVLLIAFLVIGYLIGKVEALQGGSLLGGAAPTTAPIAPDGQAPQAPTAPDPEQVKKDLKMGHFPVKGNENAPVTMVEFSDFECPFCGRFYSETLPQIISDYIDTGKVKLYYRHYPLSFHPKATPLALVAECANDQGAFWEMHDKIFDNNATVANATDDQFKQWAVDLGLDANEFNNCYDNKTHQDLVEEDTAAGTAVGVSGTPTFYINGKQLVGAQPFDSFKAIIDEELK